MSDAKKTLVAKLAEACDAVGGIEKKGTNQKQNYKYIRAADVAKAFRHELFERGIVLIGDEKELIPLEPIPTQSGGKLNMIGVKIEYTLLDSESTDKIVAAGYGIGMDSGDKAIYKAKTGALKYFLRGLGLIPDEKDDPEHDTDDSPTFQKQADGSFAKLPARTGNVQPVITLSHGAPPAPSAATPVEPKKPVARKKAVENPNKQPWGGQAGQSKSTDFPFGENQVPPAPRQEQTAHPQTAPASYNSSPNAVTPENPITDSDLPDNLQGSRLPTEDESKAFRARLIAVKDKGYGGLGQWILKKSGKPRTQDIPFAEISSMVDEVEAAETAGTLKELLSR